MVALRFGLGLAVEHHAVIGFRGRVAWAVDADEVDPFCLAVVEDVKVY
jgi:hypothetical protein